MAKSDKKDNQARIDNTAGNNQNISQSGINESLSDRNLSLEQGGREREKIISGYTGMTGKKAGDYANELSIVPGNAGGGSNSSGGSGGGGSSSSSSAPAEPDYLSVFRELAGKNAGFDSGRLSNITGVSDKLRNTGVNFGATDTSIGGLQNFAKTGGIQAATQAKIDDPTLNEFAKTGGYNDSQIANIRSRSNSAVPSFYQNLKDSQNRQRAVSNNIGPGWDRAGFRMARDAAHASADTSRDTEIGIADAVRSGRMSASSELARNALQEAGIQSANTLSGYGKSGELDIAKQRQIANDLAESGNLDLNTQMGMNQTRLGATSGISQDTLGRMSIGAASSAAGAARDQQAREWASEMAQRDSYEGNRGLLNTYGTSYAPGDKANDNLMGYRQMQGDFGLKSNSLDISNAAQDYGSRFGTIFDKGTKLIGALAGYKAAGR